MALLGRQAIATAFPDICNPTIINQRINIEKPSHAMPLLYLSAPGGPPVRKSLKCPLRYPRCLCGGCSSCRGLPREEWGVWRDVEAQSLPPCEAERQQRSPRCAGELIRSVPCALNSQ